MEEYLLAIVAQYENPSQITDKVSSIIKDYVFETPSYKKILDSLSLYAQKNDDFSSKKFLNDLPSELIKTFDTCFLLPIPKFEDLGRHRVEIEKVARELRVIFLKNKIKEITENLRGKEKEENSKEIESLGKEASMLINLLSQS